MNQILHLLEMYNLFIDLANTSVHIVFRFMCKDYFILHAFCAGLLTPLHCTCTIICSMSVCFHMCRCCVALRRLGVVYSAIDNWHHCQNISRLR